MHVGAVADTGIQTRYQIQQHVILFPEQTDGIVLLDRPVIERNRQVFKRLNDDAERGINRLFRGRGIYCRSPGAECCSGRTSPEIVIGCHGALIHAIENDPVVQRVRTGDKLFVDRDQVGARNAVEYEPRTSTWSIGRQPAAILPTVVSPISLKSS